MIDNNCVYPSLHNNSYADSNISYSYRKGSTTSTKSYSYGTAFKEKTTKGEGIACSSYANCYIGCSCQSGWTQGSVPSSGEYVWATDSRYTGVNAMSVSNVGDVNSLTEGKSTQSTSGNTQVVSLSGGVSTMSSSGGMTCYKAACPSGYYLDVPNSTYFTYTSTSGTIGLTCYKATGCKSGYYNGGSSYDYHGYKCSKCTYSCPDGYSTSTTSSSCGTGYTFKSTSATTQSGCSTQTCGMCEKKYYDPVAVKVKVTMSSKSGSVAGLKYTVRGLGGGLQGSSVTCDRNKYPDCYSENSVSPGDYTVSAMITGARIDSGFQIGAWKVVMASCPSKSINVSGEQQTQTVFINCTEGSGEITPTLPDPCTGSCSGDIPYYKTFNGNKCCCPTAGETNSRKCNCCIDIINPCPGNLYYVKSSDGSDCCCSDLNHTGGNWGSWEVPTSCYCLGPSVPQG